MRDCYVISFTDVFHFLIWRSTYFVACFHISTIQKLRKTNIGILFLTLKKRENNEKMHIDKESTRSFFIYNFWCAMNVCSYQKSRFLRAILRILIHPNPNILQISFLPSFLWKTWLANVIKLSSSYKKFRRVVFKRETSFDSKKHFCQGISISMHLLFYSHFSYLT